MLKNYFLGLLLMVVVCYAVPVEPQTISPVQTSDALAAKLDELNIDADQYYTLLLARDIGKKFGLEKVLMGIAWQETWAGKLGPIGDKDAGFGERSYGVCQVKRKTARMILKMYSKLGHFETDEELISRLMTDRTFNLTIAVHVLMRLRAQGMSEAQMIQTYNRGHTMKHPEKLHYTKSVMKATNTGIPAKVDAFEKYLSALQKG